MKMNAADKLAYVLVLVGGLNWGVVGLFEKDLVGEVFGYGSDAARVVFVVVGLAALYMTYTMFMMMSKKADSK